MAGLTREGYTELGSRFCILRLPPEGYTGGLEVYKIDCRRHKPLRRAPQGTPGEGGGIARHTRRGRFAGGEFAASPGAVRGANRAGARRDGARSAKKTGRGRVSLRFFFELEFIPARKKTFTPGERGNIRPASKKDCHVFRKERKTRQLFFMIRAS